MKLSKVLAGVGSSLALAALILPLGGGALAQRSAPGESAGSDSGSAQIDGKQAAGSRLPTREATEALDPGRLDPEATLTEHEGLAVVRRDKRRPDGSLRSRVHVTLLEGADGSVEELPHGPQFHWHPNRTLWIQRVYSKGAQNGPFREWNEAGLLQVRGEFEGDQPNGVWRKYHEDGFLLRERIWKNGKRTGITTNWYPSGPVRRTTTWADGVETGLQQLFHRNGQVSERGKLKAGRRAGLWEKFHENGKPASRGVFDESSRRSGVWQEWNEKGELLSEGRFENGRREGEWFRAQLRDALEFRENYRKGRLHGLFRRYLAGGATILLEASYESGKATGTLRTWYEDGSPRSEEEIPKEGSPRSWRRYFQGGQVECEGSLLDGLRTGVWRFYSSDGTLNPRWSGVYDRGQRVGDLPG